MAYAFKQIEAHDPNNPGLVAPNASVTIFEPGDPTKTPLTLTTLAGDPLPNPVTVNGMGYGPAFMHATLPQVAWSGGGLTGTFESYEGMRDEAIAARTAAETAAATAGADAAAVADAAIGDATAEAEAAAASAAAAEAAAASSATAAANSAALVGAPADTAIAAAINGNGATKTALSATYASTSALAAKLDKTEAATAYSPRDAVQTVFRDDFTGSALGSAWTIVRPDAAGYRVQDGTLKLDTLAGDLEATNDTAKNICLVPLPDGHWTAEVKMTTSTLATDGQRAGLIAYRGDRDYATVMYRVRPSGNSYRAFIYERTNSPRNVVDTDLTQQSLASLPAAPRFRLVSDGELVTAYDSADDGATWRVIGRPAPASAFTHVGLWAVSGTTGTVVSTVSADWFTLTSGIPVPVVPPIKTYAPFGNVNNPAPQTPTDTMSTTVRSILRNTDKYTINTWFPATYGSQGSATYLTLGSWTETQILNGAGETEIRNPASAAFGLATSLATLAYDSTGAVASRSSATATCVRLIRSIARAHRANTPATGWGYGPQTALWAALAGNAAWLIWEALTATEQAEVKRMVVAEANIRASIEPEFWKKADGSVTTGRTGNSAAEENAWNSMILDLAVSMMPTHPRRQAWLKRAVALLVTSYSKPGDATNQALMNGQPVADYMVGWNINADGTVINHDIIHPDYMASACHVLHAAVTLPLAGRRVPKAATHNMGLVYSALTDLNFTTPTYAEPGGTIYTPGSDAIYYPQGTDWGASRRMDKAAFDVMIASFGLDDGVGTTAAAWAQLHLDAALAMQNRSTTGQTYIVSDDDTYGGREQWVALHAAWAWLACWVTKNDMYRLSNLPPSEF